MEKKSMTTREAAESLGAREWQVRRLFELKHLPEPARFGGKRAIPISSLKAIAKALAARGWLLAAKNPDHPDRKESNDG